MEKPPRITKELEAKALDLLRVDSDFSKLVDDVNESYLYWSKAKYKAQRGIPPELLWAAAKIRRSAGRVIHTPIANFKFLFTTRMEKLCFDACEAIGDQSRKGSLISSAKDFEFLMQSELSDEAISSSIMEGAVTTRKAALDIIKKREPPKGVSERMVWNNFRAMQFILDNCEKEMDEALLLEIHRIVTECTLESPDYEIRFRRDEDILVVDTSKSEVVHTPPPSDKIACGVDWLCRFVNGRDENFVNPVIRGIVAHYALSYLHPFVDGNGRTARALFYFCMAKAGYTFIKYISISSKISVSKSRYEASFRESESDSLDIGYFILYNLEVIADSIEWVRKKIEESKKRARQQSAKYNGILSPRQSEIMGKMTSGEWLYADVASVCQQLNVSHPTAMKLLRELENLGLLTRTRQGRRKQAFVLADTEISL